GRPITEIKQESVVQGRLKPKKIILRIQPFLCLSIFGVNGCLQKKFSQMDSRNFHTLETIGIETGRLNDRIIFSLVWNNPVIQSSCPLRAEQPDGYEII
ncbi:hypothetical protein P4C99_22255, partial [Pontiellaceae bacterium B1224]|nr:hypothetical protein [Pontiellaceae bacterium B1224]